MKFTVENILRPCFIDGKKALFHRWADKENLIISASKAWYYSGDLFGGEI